MRLPSPFKRCRWSPLHEVLDESAEKFLSKPKPRLMTHADLPRALDAAILALADDPLVHYMRDTPDKKRKFDKTLFKVEIGVVWSSYIRNKTALVIDGGDAHLIYKDPNRKLGPIDRLLDYLAIRIFLRVLRSCTRSKEQKIRGEEHDWKYSEALEYAIPEESRQDMFFIGDVATVPSKQGHGYATTLLRVALDQADAQGRSTWLYSSNTKANTGYYNYLGFETVAEVTLGDENPTWRQEPVITAIMVRYPPSMKKSA